jgi:hypothetical protein
MRKRRLTLIVAIAVSGMLAVTYALGPYVAGACGLGDRLGPAIYSESYHEQGYILGHESAYNEKPRLPLDTWMYRRPLFYGLPRRLKPAKDRAAYIEMARRNESPMLQDLIEMNEKLQRANQLLQ